MPREIVTFLPIAGLLIGLIAPLVFDPAAQQVVWWPGIVGLVIGSVAAFIIRRRQNAR